MGVKVAVVGAGSTYTPELVEGFVTREDRLPVDQLALLDIDADRLGIVGALAERMMRKAGWGGSLVLTGDRDEAIEGADFVIVQLRVGGQAELVQALRPTSTAMPQQVPAELAKFNQQMATVRAILDGQEAITRPLPDTVRIDHAAESATRRASSTR